MKEMVVTVTFADGPLQGKRIQVSDYLPFTIYGIPYEVARFAEYDDEGNVWSVYLAFSEPVPDAITKGSYPEAPRVKRRDMTKDETNTRRGTMDKTTCKIESQPSPACPVCQRQLDRDHNTYFCHSCKHAWPHAYIDDRQAGADNISDDGNSPDSDSHVSHEHITDRSFGVMLNQIELDWPPVCRHGIKGPCGECQARI